MTPIHVLLSALTSACVALLIQLAAYFQAKTTERATQSRPAPRHADRTQGRPTAFTEEYPGRIIGNYAAHGTKTAGAPTVPPTAGAPAPHATIRQAAAAGSVWTDPSWPPHADDTHVTEAIT